MSIVLTQSLTRVRKSTPPVYADQQEASIALTEQGAVIAQPATPRLTESVRLGSSWYGRGVVTTKTLNQVVPTTTAASTLWNGNAVGGKSLVVEGIGYFTDVSGGAANLLTIYAAPSIVASATVPTTAEAATFRNLRFGVGAYGGGAKISQTVTVTDTGWLPLVTIDTAALTTNKAIGGFIPLNGLFIIAPQFYLALAATGTAATMELGYYYVFHEVQLNLV